MSSSDTDETPTISFLISNKKKRLLVIDGYIYQQNKSTAKVSYWLCEIKLCNAGVHLNSDDQFRLSSSSFNAGKETKSTNSARTNSNIETFACFWLDQDIYTTEDNRETLEELRHIINHIKVFDHVEECEQAIRNITHEKVILICSGSLGRQLVPRLHDLTQFSVCYVLCQDQAANEQWSSKYPKIQGVFVNPSKLITQLAEDQITRIKAEESATIAVVSNSTQSLESRNAMFMWFQLFIEVLLRMHHTSSARQELIDICKQNYQENPLELSIINEFEATYKPENAIWWYTRECCFYRILNKALRIQDFDMLFALRFFITDLSKQLNNEYDRYLREMPTRDIIRVYRGQAIHVKELKLIKSSIGEFLSMNAFLSTSLQRSTAVSFLNTIQLHEEIDRILFEIDIDPCEKTKAFGHIDRLSYVKYEDEVLIMLGALFRIESVSRDDKKKLWIAHVILANEDDYHLKETFAHMKGKISDETNLHSIGKILIEMGEYEQAQKCYKRMITEAQIDESIGYSGLGWADSWLNQYDEALDNTQRALSLIDKVLPDVCQQKGSLYSSMGLIYWRKKQYDQALANLKKALYIQEKILPSEHHDLLATYNRFAITYSAMNEVQMAIEYYNKCLNIRLATLPHDHPDIATSYNNLGWLFNERSGDYAKALDYFQRSLAICRKTLPPTHRDIVRTEQNIRKVTEKMRQQSKT
ncbi:unnamed protein product [Rotaria magnacalcarata]